VGEIGKLFDTFRCVRLGGRMAVCLGIEWFDDYWRLCRGMDEIVVKETL